MLILSVPDTVRPRSLDPFLYSYCIEWAKTVQYIQIYTLHVRSFSDTTIILHPCCYIRRKKIFKQINRSRHEKREFSPIYMTDESYFFFAKKDD